MEDRIGAVGIEVAVRLDVLLAFPVLGETPLPMEWIGLLAVIIAVTGALGLWAHLSTMRASIPFTLGRWFTAPASHHRQS